MAPMAAANVEWLSEKKAFGATDGAELRRSHSALWRRSNEGEGSRGTMESSRDCLGGKNPTFYVCAHDIAVDTNLRFPNCVSSFCPVWQITHRRYRATMATMRPISGSHTKSTLINNNKTIGYLKHKVRVGMMLHL